ncbi:alginate export family protein [Novosphingobium sp. 1949]|uniref:Alginate export family protein n=1 Tax=Novosphingobium organovorum TaxID=2930092 RepID=A0ABT0BES8_9SPHN|nr:alginate export family protein [Novosphingobium organovorum]MCJ2183488.1 alginate export family protein [Novosphingobium organovorum]
MRTLRAATLLACTTATLFSLPAMAQSVPPESVKDDASAPLSSQAPPGERPAKSQARSAEAMPGGRTATPGLPQLLRWTEDWSQVPAQDAPFLDKIKHIPIANDDVYLTLGGEARVYYTDWKHAKLGLTSNDSNDPVQTRLRVLADLHLGENLRAYVELGDNREHGERYTTGPNEDKLDVYQAFVDLSLPLGDAGKITVRPGRFEMPLGNGKLVGVREGLNMRFTYQGVRATYILPGKVSVDMFAVRPVQIGAKTFDDGPNHAQSFHGVYVSAPNRLAGFGTDLYWYEMKRDTAKLAVGTGSEDRDNWGARLWKRGPVWDIDLEATHQSGTFTDTTGTKDIDAWGVMFEGGYTFGASALKPRLGLRANYFSGDKDLTDGTVNTFVAASPRLPLFSEAAFFGFSNLMDLYPSVTIKPTKAITVMAGPDFLWRASKADGIYIGSSGASFTPYSASRTIGTDLNLEASWQATSRLSFRLFETYFAASNSFEDNGGKNGNYFGMLANYRF